MDNNLDFENDIKWPYVFIDLNLLISLEYNNIKNLILLFNRLGKKLNPSLNVNNINNVNNVNNINYAAFLKIKNIFKGKAVNYNI